MLIKRNFIKACSVLLAAAFITGCGNNAADNSGNSGAKNQTVEEADNEKNEETEENQGLPEKMPSFKTKDLKGNTVTDSIFKEKDLTVLNIWGTFCGPCIGEMPELAKWQESMPDNRKAFFLKNFYINCNNYMLYFYIPLFLQGIMPSWCNLWNNEQT